MLGASDFFDAEIGPWELSLISRQPAVAAADPVAGAYVAALGKALAPDVPVRFVLYDDERPLRVPWYGVLRQGPQVRVLPGNVILVPAGLFEGAATESEFAAALARGMRMPA